MGFKIRDKSLFWTRSGWKNNWEPRILNMPRGANTPFVSYLSCRYDSNSFLRSTLSILFFSGAKLQKLFTYLQAIPLWGQRSRKGFDLGTQSAVPYPLHLSDSSRAHQARRRTQLKLYFSKED
jgi:hypothetical protein